MLIHIYEEHHKERSGGKATPLKSKVMFALKQLCNTAERKDEVGQKIIKTLLEDLRGDANLEKLDWAVNAVMLLHNLAVSKRCCDMMLDFGWDTTLPKILDSRLATMDATKDRIDELKNRIDELKTGKHKRNSELQSYDGP